MPEIIEKFEHSKNPFERVHWQTCALFWEYDLDMEQVYETGKEAYETGQKLLETLLSVHYACKDYPNEPLPEGLLIEIKKTIKIVTGEEP